MYVSEVETVKLSLSGRECVDIAIYLKRAVEDNAKNHHLKWYLERYSDHSEEGFYKYLYHLNQEKFYIDAIKTLSYVGGCPNFYDDLLYQIEQIYKKGVKKESL